MGRDLLGRELGKGIRQEAPGVYVGRYLEYDRRYRSKTFTSLKECREWLAENRGRQIPYHMLKNPGSITVDVWLWYYLEQLYRHRVRENSYLKSKKLLRLYVRPLLGEVLLRELRSDAIQRVLVDMQQRGLARTTIEAVRTTLHDALEKAVEFELIKKNPVNRLVVIPRDCRKRTRRKILSRQEQAMLLRHLKGTVYYNPVIVLLTTGLRIGELMGLTWEDVDFTKNTIAIRRTMEDKGGEHWRIGPPKSRTSERVILMNRDCRQALLRQREFDRSLKKIPIRFVNTVFLMRNGCPRRLASYDAYLYRTADKLGIERFSVHALRHTYATRCIEEGMNPKSLQVLLGHSSMEITLNRYVHVTEEESVNEIHSIEDKLDVEKKTDR